MPVEEQEVQVNENQQYVSETLTAIKNYVDNRVDSVDGEGVGAIFLFTRNKAVEIFTLNNGDGGGIIDGDNGGDGGINLPPM